MSIVDWGGVPPAANGISPSHEELDTLDAAAREWMAQLDMFNEANGDQGDTLRALAALSLAPQEERGARDLQDGEIAGLSPEGSDEGEVGYGGGVSEETDADELGEVDEESDNVIASSFADVAFTWHPSAPGADGAGGSYFIDERGQLVVRPTAQLDYWSRTYYEPLLNKTDGQALLCSVDATVEATLSLAFTLHPRAQFDQAGVLVRVDERTWCKAGVEYVDGAPRLSCVVTNDGFSDSSTHPWDVWDEDTSSTSLRLRVHKLLPGDTQGPALVVEAAPYMEGDAVGSSPSGFSSVRIASLRSADLPWEMGAFCFAPLAQDGSLARFHYVRLGGKMHAAHPSNALAMAG